MKRILASPRKDYLGGGDIARIIEMSGSLISPRMIAFDEAYAYIVCLMSKGRNRISAPPEQQEFQFAPVARTKTAVLEYLCSGAGPTVHLTITRNRVNMVSIAIGPAGTARVRLQEAFLSAPDEVLEAIRVYLRVRKRAAWDLVSTYARQVAPAGGTRQGRLLTAGQLYDLAEIAHAVNCEFFEGRVKYRIGWSRSPKRRPRRTRSIRYGSWDPHTGTIRVHPRLDDSRVPQQFVRYIVFHEMLHAVVQPVAGKGSRRDHPAEFRVLERRFPDLPGMKRMARSLLHVL